MKKLTAVVFVLVALVLSGCTNAMKNLADSGAFEPETCYDSEGRKWTGAAACQELARAQGEAAKEAAKANLVASIQQPTTDDPTAWDKYYEAVEDAPLKASVAGAGGEKASPVQSPRTHLLATAMQVDSNEKIAFTRLGVQGALAGVDGFFRHLDRKYDYKEAAAMYDAFSRPNISVSGFGGAPGSTGATGGPGGEAPGGTAAATSNSQTILAIDSAVGTEGSRVMQNRDGFQAGAHDDAAALAARNVTDPTQLTGPCDDGESLCDGATAPFLQQENPTNADTSLLKFGGSGR